MFCLYTNKYVAQDSYVYKLFFHFVLPMWPIFFKGKSNYPAFLHVRTTCHPKLIWISGVLLYYIFFVAENTVICENAQIENIFLGHVAVCLIIRIFFSGKFVDCDLS